MKDPIIQKVKTELLKLGDIEYIYWLDDKYRFVEFEISGKGRGVYSVLLKKIILELGWNSEIKVDDPMGLIFYKKFADPNFYKINFEGEQILTD